MARVHVHVYDAAPIKAAGILFVAKSKVLVLLRSPEANNDGYWDLPGGKMAEVDSGDLRSCAVRESQEELGLEPNFALEQDKLVKINRTVDNVDYTTYLCRCDKFDPILSSEHSEYKWAKLHDLPSPLHHHLKDLLNSLVLDAR